jgi:hypothetical protein
MQKFFKANICYAFFSVYFDLKILTLFLKIIFVVIKKEGNHKTYEKKFRKKIEVVKP